MSWENLAGFRLRFPLSQPIDDRNGEGNQMTKNSRPNRKTIGKPRENDGCPYGNSWDLPSGKQPHNKLERSTICKMGKLTINGPVRYY